MAGGIHSDAMSSTGDVTTHLLLSSTFTSHLGLPVSPAQRDCAMSYLTGQLASWGGIIDAGVDHNDMIGRQVMNPNINHRSLDAISLIYCASLTLNHGDLVIIWVYHISSRMDSSESRGTKIFQIPQQATSDGSVVPQFMDKSKQAKPLQTWEPLRAKMLLQPSFPFSFTQTTWRPVKAQQRRAA